MRLAWIVTFDEKWKRYHAVCSGLATAISADRWIELPALMEEEERKAPAGDRSISGMDRLKAMLHQLKGAP